MKETYYYIERHGCGPLYLQQQTNKTRINAPLVEIARDKDGWFMAVRSDGKLSCCQIRYCPFCGNHLRARS